LQGVNITTSTSRSSPGRWMRWVKIEDVCDTEFLVDEQTDKFPGFRRERGRVIISRVDVPGLSGLPSCSSGFTKAFALDRFRVISASGRFQNDARAHRGVPSPGIVPDHLRRPEGELSRWARLIPACHGLRVITATCQIPQE